MLRTVMKRLSIIFKKFTASYYSSALKSKEMMKGKEKIWFSKAII